MRPRQTDYQLVKDMYKNGARISEICEAVKRSESTIRRIIKFDGKQSFIDLNRSRLKR